MGDSAVEPRERVRRVGLALGPALFALLLALPALTPGLEPKARATAAVTALVATFWLTGALPLGATSLLPAVLFPLLGVVPAGEASQVYASDLVMLFLGAFLVAIGVERWGVHRRVALAIIAAVGTRPTRLVLGFMAASAFLSMWISNTATTLMMLPIALATIAAVAPDAPDATDATGAIGPGREASQQPPSAFALALLLGIAYAASIGGLATPVGTPTNQVLLGQYAQRFPEADPIGFGSWLAAWLPLVGLLLVLTWVLLTRVCFPVRASSTAGADTIRAARASLGPVSSAERRMAAVFVVTALLWVTRAGLDLGPLELPGWSVWFERGGGGRWVSDATVALGMGVLCFALPAGTGDGQRLLDWRAAERMPWEILLLIGGGFCIALGFRESGLDAVLGSALAPALAGRDDWVVVASVCLLMTFLTEVTSNTATTTVLLPVLAGAAVEAGLDPLALMAPATVAASTAFMLPVATPPNAVVFSSRLIPMGAMARAGLLLNLAAVALITLVFELWGKRLL